MINNTEEEHGLFSNDVVRNFNTAVDNCHKVFILSDQKVIPSIIDKKTEAYFYIIKIQMLTDLPYLEDTPEGRRLEVARLQRYINEEYNFKHVFFTDQFIDCTGFLTTSFAFTKSYRYTLDNKILAKKQVFKTFKQLACKYPNVQVMYEGEVIDLTPVKSRRHKNDHIVNSNYYKLEFEKLKAKYDKLTLRLRKRAEKQRAQNG